jgi:hypothetical protein
MVMIVAVWIKFGLLHITGSNHRILVISVQKAVYVTRTDVFHAYQPIVLSKEYV